MAMLALVAIVGSGCVPSPGPFHLAETNGVVVDRDDRTPIAEAWVIQWYRGGGVPGASQPEYHSRFTRSDSEGQFHFDGGIAPSPRMWVLRTYGPSYSFFHPSYGLLHGGVREGQATVELSGSKEEAALRQADLRPVCQGEITGPGAQRLAQLACPSD